MGVVLGFPPLAGGSSRTSRRAWRTKASTAPSIKLVTRPRGDDDDGDDDDDEDDAASLPLDLLFDLRFGSGSKARELGGIAFESIWILSRSSSSVTGAQRARPSLSVGANCSLAISSRASLAASIQNRRELPKTIPAGGWAGRSSSRSRAGRGSKASASTRQGDRPRGSSDAEFSLMSQGDGSGPLLAPGRRKVFVSIPEGVGPKIVSISSLSIFPGTENGWGFGVGRLGGLPRAVGRLAGRAEDSAQR